ncbi:MAG: hypothetical protein A2787_08930 [Omnitrophica WOR_2 bacterium RIFCSPHIGHO2_01_FULL_48_9]|nr:MAG: hypothetical protein A2787_08930 [Omnitrophica WOR_2 bacterium RIFCSPHIGHO2_01_FULL_48_9]
MIKIDLSLAVSCYLFFTLLLVCALWIFYNWDKGSSLAQQSQYMEQCPYCTYVFFNYRQAKVALCPRCKSYLEIERGRTENHVPPAEKK